MSNLQLCEASQAEYTVQGFAGRFNADVGRLRATRDSCWWQHRCQAGGGNDRAEEGA